MEEEKKVLFEEARSAGKANRRALASLGFFFITRVFVGRLSRKSSGSVLRTRRFAIPLLTGFPLRKGGHMGMGSVRPYVGCAFGLSSKVQLVEEWVSFDNATPWASIAN